MRIQAAHNAYILPGSTGVSARDAEGGVPPYSVRQYRVVAARMGETVPAGLSSSERYAPDGSALSAGLPVLFR